jgi:arylsulfatase
VIFTSDHGELLGDHGLLRKGPPPYRQLIQVPFIISGPGIVSGAKIDELTSHIDLLPTLASMLTGTTVRVDGVDLRAAARKDDLRP